MSVQVQVYRWVLKEAEVPDILPDIELVRRVFDVYTVGELVEKIGVSEKPINEISSLLKDKPTHYKQCVFLGRLYVAEVPVPYKDLRKGIDYPEISSDVLEEMKVIKTGRIVIKGGYGSRIVIKRGYGSRIEIIEKNKSRMKKIWPNIENFLTEYTKRQPIQNQNSGLWIQSARIERARNALMRMPGGITKKNIRKLTRGHLDSEEDKLPRGCLTELRKTLLKKVERGEL